MPITPLPPVPLRSDAAEVFVEKADTFMAALPTFATEANSVENALQTSTVIGTSTTSLTLGTGSKTLTTQTGKGWVVGSWIYIVCSTAITNTMQGQVTAYNSGTGSLTVNVTSIYGSGTFANWAIGLSVTDGKLNNAVDVWLLAQDNSQRMVFASGADTTIKGYGSFPLHVINSADSISLSVRSDGRSTLGASGTEAMDATTVSQIQKGAHVASSAGGTADNILASFSPEITVTELAAGTAVRVLSSGANTSTVPTLNVGTTGAGTIVKGNDLPLAVGDIPGAGYWCEFVLNQAMTKWVLQNPAKGINPQISGGTLGSIPYQSATNTTAVLAPGSAGQFLQSAGAAAPVFASPPSVTGTFKNLRLSTTGTSAPVTVTADEIVVSDGAGYYKTLSNVSLSIAGTSSGVANGLDTGSLEIYQWYSVWVIWNGGTTAGLLSVSDVAPTLPSGYTFKARVGWMRTDGTGNKYPLRMTQGGRVCQYSPASGSNLLAYPVLASGTPAFPQSVGVNAYVPPTSLSIRLGVFCGSNGTNSGMARASPNLQVNETASNPSPLMATTGNYQPATSVGAIVLESGNVYWGVSGAPGTSSIFAVGWEDNL